jgi:hypothetical protein
MSKPQVINRRAVIGLLGAGAGAAAAALLPESAASASTGSSVAGSGPVIRVTSFGAVGDGVADDTSAIQGAIDAASVSGGVVYLPAGEYRLTRQPGEATLTLKSNVTVRGDGVGTHIFLDPATPPDSARHYVMRVGGQNEAASDIVVEDLKLTVNNAAIAGGSLMGICARHDGTDKTIHSDNVLVRNCHIVDSQIAVGCTKSAVTGPYPEARLNGQFRNWVVENCVLDLSGNKMIELGECDYGVIRNNLMTRCADGPQAIFHSRNILIDGNRINYTVSGINVTAGSNNITIIGNVVEADASIAATATSSALYFRTEATTATDYVQSDIRSIGNVYRDTRTNTKRAFRTGTRTEVSSSVYQRASFVGDTFDGAVQLADLLAPGTTTIRDFTFTNCTFLADIVTVPDSTMASADVTLVGCDLRRAAGYTINADRWSVQNCRIRGPVSVSATATAAIVTGNRVDGTITDAGIGSLVADNKTP